MDLDAQAAIAADPDVPARERVEALVTVVETVSIDEVPIPDRIVDALEDIGFVDAAVALDHASAVCAALVQLGDRADLATTRRRVVRRLVAAGASGINLAGLALEIGDLASGVALAVRDYDRNIVSRASGPRDNLVGAWLGWLADQSDVAASAILAQLDLRSVSLETLLAHNTNPARTDRLRKLARSIVPS